MLDRKKLQNVFEMMMSDCIDAPLWPYHITKTNFFKKHGASARPEKYAATKKPFDFLRV